MEGGGATPVGKATNVTKKKEYDGEIEIPKMCRWISYLRVTEKKREKERNGNGREDGDQTAESNKIETRASSAQRCYMDKRHLGMEGKFMVLNKLQTIRSRHEIVLSSCDLLSCDPM